MNGIHILVLAAASTLGGCAATAPHVVPEWIQLTDGDQARCQEALSRGAGGCAVFTEAELRVLLFQSYQKGRKDGAKDA